MNLRSRWARFQGSGIVRYQTAEMHKFTVKNQLARSASNMDHFTRIGPWVRTLAGVKILELGCGPGRYIPLLRANGAQVVGVDPHCFESWTLLDEFDDVELHSEVFAENLQFADDSFDGITCLGALLYFKNPSEALNEVLRVLKPGGGLLMRNPNVLNNQTRRTGQPLDPMGKNLYNEKELIDLLETHGFKVSQSWSYGYWPSFFGRTWWWLVNGVISIGLQSRLSRLTPATHRVNIVVEAVKQ